MMSRIRSLQWLALIGCPAVLHALPQASQAQRFASSQFAFTTATAAQTSNSSQQPQSKLHGRWICTDSTIDGDAVGTGVLSELLILDGQLYWIGVESEAIRFAEDPAASEIEYTLPEGDLRAKPRRNSWFAPARSDGSSVTWKYQLDGDWLFLAGNHDASRPIASMDDADRQYRFRQMKQRSGWDELEAFPIESTPSLSALIHAIDQDADIGFAPMADAGVIGLTSSGSGRVFPNLRWSTQCSSTAFVDRAWTRVPLAPATGLEFRSPV